MMQSEKYNSDTAEGRVDTNNSGRLWMQQLELMQNNKTSRLENDPDRGPFITIDDLQRLAQELVDGLNRLGDYKRPLDIRRGRKGVKNMIEQDKRSETVKAGSKTYFFDIKETREGNPYLVITESRFKGEGGDRERKTIVVFQENASEFADAVSKMTAKLDEG